MKSKINFHIDQDIKGVELMEAYCINNKSHLHTHSEFAIGVIESGMIEHTPKRFHHTYFEKGHIPLLNPDQPHSGVNLDAAGTKYRMFYIQAEVLRNIASEINLREEDTLHFSEIAITDRYLERHLIRLHHYLSTGAYTPMQRQHYFYEAFAYLLQHYATAKPQAKKISYQQGKINRVIEYINTYYTQKISLQELAELADLSPFYLNRVFAKAKGMAPHQYLIDLRLKKAKLLLIKGEKVTEVALEVGFFDQSHFTRNFKHYLGLTPKQYQMEIR